MAQHPADYMKRFCAGESARATRRPSLWRAGTPTLPAPRVCLPTPPPPPPPPPHAMFFHCVRVAGRHQAGGCWLRVLQRLRGSRARRGVCVPRRAQAGPRHAQAAAGLCLRRQAQGATRLPRTRWPCRAPCHAQGAPCAPSAHGRLVAGWRAGRRKRGLRDGGSPNGPGWVSRACLAASCPQEESETAVQHGWDARSPVSIAAAILFIFTQIKASTPPAARAERAVLACWGSRTGASRTHTPQALAWLASRQGRSAWGRVCRGRERENTVAMLRYARGLGGPPAAGPRAHGHHCRRHRRGRGDHPRHIQVRPSLLLPGPRGLLLRHAAQTLLGLRRPRASTLCSLPLAFTEWHIRCSCRGLWPRDACMRAWLRAQGLVPVPERAAAPRVPDRRVHRPAAARGRVAAQGARRQAVTAAAEESVGEGELSASSLTCWHGSQWRENCRRAGGPSVVR